MTWTLESAALAVFLIFCRVGMCIMVMPGLSSVQINRSARLLLAIACTLSLSPLLMHRSAAALAGATGMPMAALIAGECLIGVMIGFMGRLFFLALDYLLAAIAGFIGFGGFPGTPVEQDLGSSPLTSLVGITATLLIFVLDLHHEVLGGLLASYDVLLVGRPFDAQGALSEVVDVASKTFMLSLSIGGPFLLYSVVVNTLFGVINKQLPQVPIYFFSVPFVLAGGLLMLGVVLPDAVHAYMMVFARWLAEGSL